MESKYCKYCDTTKLLSEFHFKNKALGRYRDRCKICAAKYHKEHYEANKAVYAANRNKNRSLIRDEVNRLKLVPCADCGVNYPPYVMDFDHLHDKRGNISQMVGSVSKECLLLEISKCDIVCANCHRKRTYKRKESENIHKNQ